MADTSMIGYVYDPNTGKHEVRVALNKRVLNERPRCSLCQLHRGTVRLRQEDLWVCRKCAPDVPLEQLPKNLDVAQLG